MLERVYGIADALQWIQISKAIVDLAGSDNLRRVCRTALSRILARIGGNANQRGIRHSVHDVVEKFGPWQAHRNRRIPAIQRGMKSRFVIEQARRCEQSDQMVRGL